MDMLHRAQHIIKKHQTNNPEKILADLNIPVLSCQLTGPRGMVAKIKRNTIVVIDENLDDCARAFVLAHELGHYLFHRGENRIFLERCTYLKTNKAEEQADLFAVCLLFPYPNEIIFENESIDQLAETLGVSRSLAMAYIKAISKN